MWIYYVILGIIQGVTEYFPISSSGHLILLQRSFGLLDKSAIFTDITLHLATLCTTVIFFYRDILRFIYEKDKIVFIGVTTLITTIMGLAFKDVVEKLFSNILIVIAGFSITGITILLTKNLHQKKCTESKMNISDALIFGCAQGLALLPGVSRSGMTVSALIFIGYTREFSFKLSFIASIPIILFVFVYKLKDAYPLVINAEIFNLSIGFVTTIFVGLFTLKLLYSIIKKARFYIFGYYCLFVAVFLVFYHFLVR